MKLKLDLHVHSEASYDGRMTLGEIVETARAAGLDGVAVCDHDILSSALSDFTPPDGFILIKGEEFSTEYGHVLGLFLEKPVGERAFSSVVRAVREQGGICVLAHPFERCLDPDRFLPIAGELDGVEVQNGRANRKNRRANEMAAEFAAKTGLPAFAGSDAHLPREIGNGVVTIRVSEASPEAVRSALLTPGNETSGRDGRHIDVARSQWTKLRKTHAGAAKRLRWLAFLAKCVLGDLFRKH